MTKLKYGKIYINKGDILKAIGLPEDVHLELIGNNTDDGSFEFKVVSSDEIEHECLADSITHGVNNLRRYTSNL